MSDESVPAVMAKCTTCQGTVFVAVDLPERQKDLAKEVAALIRNGLRPFQTTVGECRKADWCKCERKPNRRKSKQKELSL